MSEKMGYWEGRPPPCPFPYWSPLQKVAHIDPEFKLIAQQQTTHLRTTWRDSSKSQTCRRRGCPAQWGPRSKESSTATPGCLRKARCRTSTSGFTRFPLVNFNWANLKWKVAFGVMFQVEIGGASSPRTRMDVANLWINPCGFLKSEGAIPKARGSPWKQRAPNRFRP